MPEQCAKIRLYGLNLFNLTLNHAAQLVLDLGKLDSVHTINFINAHCINVAAVHAGYYHAIQQSDILFADGSGIAISAKLNRKKFIDNVNGTDLFPIICQMAETNKVSIGLLGAKPGVANSCQIKMNKKYPALNFSYVHDGYFEESIQDKIINDISKSGTNILFVAMGVPDQELLMEQWKHKLHGVGVIIGVGALFDFYSDSVSRAPLWMRNMGIEWFYRLLQEPKRLFKRYMIGNFVFLNRALLLKFRNSMALENEIRLLAANK